MTAALIDRSHLMRPADVAGEIARAARPLGVSGVQVYLADLQQRHLSPLAAADGRPPDVLLIDSTLAGRAYQTITVQAGRADGAHQLWIPLVDGTERLGVLGLAVADVSEPMMARYRTLASLAGMLVAGKSSHSDTYAQVQRTMEMALQAELVWAFLPPRTFATDRVLVTATLEPAYAAGGDAFDYSLLGEHLHISIFDALGHDLAAGLLASVGLASCRSARRAGGSLASIRARADHAIARQFGNDRFVTALLCDLDLTSGLLSWIPCGHPAPLLIRGNRTVKELARPPQSPLGLAARDKAGFPDLPGALEQTEKLEPGDRLLLYTDGVTEGRAADGTPFGTERLADFIIRHSSTGLPAPEMMRRLNRAILEYQHGRLRDDATAILVEWKPDRTARSLTPLPSWPPRQAASISMSRARRRAFFFSRRARIRSSGVVPPQMPSVSPALIAKSRHSRRTRQPAQTRRAWAICAAPFPAAEMGKNRSGSADAQAPASRHPAGAYSVMAILSRLSVAPRRCPLGFRSCTRRPSFLAAEGPGGPALPAAAGET
jgi:stage II sporulation SpoE-like protein